MRLVPVLMAAALALAACDRDAAPPEPKVGDLSSPRLSGRFYTCNLTYTATHGPIVEQSRATVRMGVDTTSAAAGWQVESVLITEPLPAAEDFDPWLVFMPRTERKFVAQAGPIVTLAVADGAPVVLDTMTGALRWRSQNMLGATEYAGDCY